MKFPYQEHPRQPSDAFLQYSRWSAAVLLIGLCLFSVGGVFAETKPVLPAVKPAVEQPVKELHYPPIRIEVTESKLSQDLRKDKDELIQGSQTLEDILHKSGAVYRDPELEQAIHDLIPPDRMGEKSRGFYFRVYLLKDPDVNAMTTPSGSIYVNSGLLATLDSFDQLRAVMAHEAHHAIDQDIVYEFRKYKNETGFLKVFNLLAAPAVAFAISESDSQTASTIANVYTASSYAINIAYQLSIFGYSRGDENECDEYAMNLLLNNRQDVHEVKKVFEKFEEERQKYGKGIFQTHLFATHETAKQRMARVDKFIQRQGAPGSPAEAPRDQRYHELTRNLRILNARLNIRMGRVRHALDDLERLKELFPADARVLNALGEAHAKLAGDRKILEDELSRKEWNKIKKEKEKAQRDRWIEQSASFFGEAIKLDPAFPDPYQGEALLREGLKENDKAIGLFQKYLELAPEARDRRYVQAKIERLKGIIEKEKNKPDKEKGTPSA
ncbi:MAG: M48 family metalloprotease [Candidatus Omnitrophica bacterium]|nr:M48 family metalloprotease [Candidatus Omnitrophota bacterium]